jgi:CRP-like cAMP-binding protein
MPMVLRPISRRVGPRRGGIFERIVPAGKYTCRRDEPVEHGLCVIEGFLKVSSDLDSGKTSTRTGVPPGGWFGG